MTTCPQRRDSTTAPSLRLKQKAQCMSIPYSRPKIQARHMCQGCTAGGGLEVSTVACTLLCSSTLLAVAFDEHLCRAGRAGTVQHGLDAFEPQRAPVLFPFSRSARSGWQKALDAVPRSWSPCASCGGGADRRRRRSLGPHCR